MIEIADKACTVLVAPFHFFDLDKPDRFAFRASELKYDLEYWNWCEQYKERVQDYNFGTLLKLDQTDDYTEKNSCFALRVQFLAIEIARNKEGKNQKIFEAAKAAKEAAAKSSGGCCSKCWLELNHGLTNNELLPFELNSIRTSSMWLPQTSALFFC